MKHIIHRAIKTFPNFRTCPFILSHKEWDERIRKVNNAGWDLYHDCYSWKGRGPIGSTCITIKNHFVYVETLDTYGFWEPLMMTHEVIAQGGNNHEYWNHRLFTDNPLMFINRDA